MARNFCAESHVSGFDHQGDTDFVMLMRMRNCVAFTVLVSLGVVPLSAVAQNVLTAQQWREDLRYLAEQIPKTHPRAFHQITRQQFETAVADLDARIPELSDHAVEVEFARLVALLGEGHSRLSLPGLPDPMTDVPDVTPFKDPRLAFHRLPVRLYLFSDGLFVTAATGEFRSLVGARVLRIGSRPAQVALDAVQPVINRDNDMGVRLIAPDLVVVPEVLYALHVIAEPSHSILTFRTKEGKEVDVDLSPLPAGAQPRWLGSYENFHAPLPLCLHHSDKNLWAEYLADSKTVFIRINVIQDSAIESVAQFARQVSSLAGSSPAERVVIDLRDCHGGDNQKFRALLLEFIRDARINKLGRLFVIIGRGTFSAAVNATSDLERLSNSIFVGEPTAGAPSSWGDPKKIILPNSGLIARVSTIYWRDWTPDESLPWIAPDVSATASSADYFAGRDPAMDAVFHFPKQTGFGDVLENVVRAGGGIETIVRLYYQHKTDALWADESTEHAMQRLGAHLVSTKAYREALLIFKVNFSDYPASLSAALQTVQKARESDPRDQALADLANKLSDLKGPP